MVYCRPGDLAGLATVGDGLEIRKSTIRNAGNGLFAKRKFQAKQLITEYCGEVISRDAAVSIRQADPSAVSHFRSLGYHQVIAGYKEKEQAIGKGGASFANDGSKQKRNNAKLRSFEMRHTLQVRVFLVADREIDVDEEILTVYGKGYWKPARPVPAATAASQSENWPATQGNIPLRGTKRTAATNSKDKTAAIAASQSENWPTIQGSIPFRGSKRTAATNSKDNAAATVASQSKNWPATQGSITFRGTKRTAATNSKDNAAGEKRARLPPKPTAAGLPAFDSNS